MLYLNFFLKVQNVKFNIQIKALGILHMEHHAKSMSTILNSDMLHLFIFQFCNEVEDLSFTFQYYFLTIYYVIAL